MCESEGGGSFLATPVKVVGGVLLAAAAVSAAGGLLAAVGGFLAHVAWLLAAGGLASFAVPAVVLRWLGKRLTLVSGPIAARVVPVKKAVPLYASEVSVKAAQPAIPHSQPPAIEPARVIPPPGWTLDGHRLPDAIPARLDSRK